MGYESKCVAVPQLDADTRERMAALYLSIYDGSSRELFLTDLAAKDEALLIFARSTLEGGGASELVGFSTLAIDDRSWQGRPTRVVYSGDTLIMREHWGQQQLAVAFITRLGELKRQAPERFLYWLLLVKGHRTFKYLPAFGNSFWPHWSIDRSDLKPLVDELASEKFGSEYNPVSGVVEFPTSRGHLRAELAEPEPEELTREAVQAFLQRNPGFRQGHELVCLCEVELDNMTPLAQQLFLQGPPSRGTLGGVSQGAPT